MADCPHCHKELPTPSAEEAFEEIKNIPGLMKMLGEEAGKIYIKNNFFKEKTNV